jgi:hypothetical protein
MNAARIKLLSLGLLFAAAICGLFGRETSFSASAPPSQDQTSDDSTQEKPEDIFPYRLDRDRPRITTGDEELAKKYYTDLAERLSFPGKQVPTLDGLLGYFGYVALKAAAVDRLSPDELMDAALLSKRFAKAPAPNEFTAGGKWDLLAAGYFAPKTSDVSNRSHKISWRKIVRFKPRPGSPAEKNGLTAMYFLSVIYVEPKDLDKSPFELPSQSVQVMLVADPNNPRSKLADAACWLIFSPKDGYRPAYSTTTSWDAADDSLTQGLQPYYLPSACQQCHGGDDRTKATPHFIDTDYSWDKTGPGEDFEQTVGRSRWSALFETGKDADSKKYHAAFDVFRRLNGEILEHNKAVNPRSLQSYGASNWMRLHDSQVGHVPPIARAWQTDVEQWSENQALDRALLPLLDHYCYRCHGTVRYNVFAKKAKGQSGEDLGVLSRVDKMIKKITSGAMPQDRELTQSQKDQLVSLLKQLQQQ